jgi:hypothetical protein
LGTGARARNDRDNLWVGKAPPHGLQ